MDHNRHHHAPNAASGMNGTNGNGTTPVQGRFVEIPGLSRHAGRFVFESRAVQVPHWKRIFDVACIVLTLAVWLPLMLLVMALVRFASPGPIFYRQERIGYRGRRFMIFKFRTMHLNVETDTHEDYVAQLIRNGRPMIKLDSAGDSRLIRGGRFLRASGLDELPQIFNVLRGQMSLVGPRPCLPKEFEGYEPWQRQRVNALPGLTGFWQVNGKNDTTFKEMVVLDLFYIRNMSLWLDLRIMFKTIPTVFREISKVVGRVRKRLIQRPVLAEVRLARKSGAASS